jgi:hypothetical protein
LAAFVFLLWVLVTSIVGIS